MSKVVLASELVPGDRIVDSATPALNPIARRDQRSLAGQTVLRTVPTPGNVRIQLVGRPDYSIHPSHRLIVDDSTIVI